MKKILDHFENVIYEVPEGVTLKDAIEKAVNDGVSFMGANLEGVNLDGIKLQDGCFAFANLFNASFKGASLTDVNFEGSTLESANFSNAVLRNVRTVNSLRTLMGLYLKICILLELTSLLCLKAMNLTRGGRGQ